MKIEAAEKKRHMFEVDPGLCWTIPPQRFTDPIISHSPEKAVHMELGSLSFWNSGISASLDIWPSRPVSGARALVFKSSQRL